MMTVGETVWWSRAPMAPSPMPEVAPAKTAVRVESSRDLLADWMDAKEGMVECCFADTRRGLGEEMGVLEKWREVVDYILCKDGVKRPYGANSPAMVSLAGCPFEKCFCCCVLERKLDMRAVPRSEEGVSGLDTYTWPGRLMWISARRVDAVLCLSNLAILTGELAMSVDTYETIARYSGMKPEMSDIPPSVKCVVVVAVLRDRSFLQDSRASLLGTTRCVRPHNLSLGLVILPSSSSVSPSVIHARRARRKEAVGFRVARRTHGPGGADSLAVDRLSERMYLEVRGCY